MAAAKLKIVVGGYIVGMPLAGLTWHHLHYLLGLHRLGHEVFFLEDSGTWAVPYDPQRQTTDPVPTYGTQYLRRCLQHAGLKGKIGWTYVSRLTREGGRPAYFGNTKRATLDALKNADLFVAVSGVTPLDPDRPRPRRTLAIDTDPVYTQVRMTGDADFAGYWRDFDRLASFGTLIGTDGCDVPDCGLTWHPTRQPVVSDQWQLGDVPADGPMTTLGRWEHDGGRHLEFGEKALKSSKEPGWQATRELPGRVDVPMRMAMDHVPKIEQSQFAAAGWAFDDAPAASTSLAKFGEFVGKSLGEFTPAKAMYAEVHSGWFGDRSACYLAAGRPVVTQQTGFDRGPLALPTGEGLFAWNTVEDAAAAINSVAADPARHSAAARRVARQHFEFDRVLPDLIDHAMS